MLDFKSESESGISESSESFGITWNRDEIVDNNEE